MAARTCRVLAAVCFLGCNGGLTSVASDAATDAGPAPEVLSCKTSLADFCGDAGACCIENLADVPLEPCSRWSCGPYVGVVESFVDTYSIDYYDAVTGKLVARATRGLADYCFAGPAAFTIPECVLPPPICGQESGCTYAVHVPTDLRRCSSTASCADFDHHADCSGTRASVGVNSACVQFLQRTEGRIQSSCPLCNGAPGPTTADDGTMEPWDAGQPGAHCVFTSDAGATGICVTSFADGG